MYLVPLNYVGRFLVYIVGVLFLEEQVGGRGSSSRTARGNNIASHALAVTGSTESLIHKFK